MEVKKNVLGAIAAAVPHLYMQARPEVLAPFEDQQADPVAGNCP